MSNILSRIQEIALNEGITIGALERQIGASKGVLSRAISNGTDIQSKWIQTIVENYPSYSTRWLLTGEGSMLRDNKIPEESKRSNTPITTPISPAEESIIYKMYKDEKEEKEKLVKEKEAKIDQLQTELREKSEELAALKASHQNFHSHGHHDQPDNAEEIHKGLGHAKNASTKQPSSPNADNATSATAQ
jgi:hypothetical protein